MHRTQHEMETDEKSLCSAGVNFSFKKRPGGNKHTGKVDCSGLAATLGGRRSGTRSGATASANPTYELPYRKTIPNKFISFMTLESKRK